MGRKNLIYVVLAIFVILTVSGCETVPKKFKEEVLGIKTRVDTLESRVEGVEAKQAEVERAVSERPQPAEEMKAPQEGAARTNIGIKHRGGKQRGHMREIQLCLRNAGFYKGDLDGVKGKNTKRAIKEFQKANGLSADGVVGKKTWELLSKYASGSVQSSGGEEGAK